MSRVRRLGLSGYERASHETRFPAPSQQCCPVAPMRQGDFILKEDRNWRCCDIGKVTIAGRRTSKVGKDDGWRQCCPERRHAEFFEREL